MLGFEARHLKTTQSRLDEFATFLRETNYYSSAEIYCPVAVQKFIDWKQLRRQKPSLKWRHQQVQRPLRLFLKWYGHTSKSKRLGVNKINPLIDSFISEVGWQYSGKPEVIRHKITEFAVYRNTFSR